MPILVNPETDKPVGFRCEAHREVPVHNLNAGEQAECAACSFFDALHQGADAMLGRVGEIVDSAATQLEFFSPGAGQGFRDQAARIIDGWQTGKTDEQKGDPN